jgi:hypothetical protein
MNQEELMGKKKPNQLIRTKIQPAPFKLFGPMERKIHPNRYMAKTGMFSPINKNHNQGR